MPSDADAVIEEFTVEDAELVVQALREHAGNLVESNPVIEAWQQPNVPDQLRIIANHLAMEAGKVRMRAERAALLPTTTSPHVPRTT